MNGKSKCKILKDIRKQIAQENDIAYVTSECKYQGDCLGTCPKCESEVRYLENELEKRRKAGKKVVLAGIAAATIMGLAACGSEDSTASENDGSPPPASTSVEELEGDVPASTDDIPVSTDRVEIEGDFALPPEDDEEPPTLMGEPVIEYPGDDEELGGDPIWEDEETKETLPPFIDEEPGVDTGDWGPLF